MKKLLSAVLIIAALLTALTACNSTIPARYDDEIPEPEQDYYYVSLEVADYGTIILELDSEAAPISVMNFVGLVEDGFYDGLTFHRIMSNFMIQGGDPKANGTGSSSTTIKGEFSGNGWDNPISHERGVISMARGDGVNSASCQFFICNADATYLDGSYAAFGRVIEGMDVVDAITADKSGLPNASTALDKSSQPVITRATVLDGYTK